MADCDMCGDREGKHRSSGGSILCHECAHETGLGHYHKDPNYPYRTPNTLDVSHVLELEGVELKDHLAAYLEVKK